MDEVLGYAESASDDRRTSAVVAGRWVSSANGSNLAAAAFPSPDVLSLYFSLQRHFVTVNFCYCAPPLDFFDVISKADAGGKAPSGRSSGRSPPARTPIITLQNSFLRHPRPTVQSKCSVTRCRPHLPPIERPFVILRKVLATDPTVVSATKSPSAICAGTECRAKKFVR